MTESEQFKEIWEKLSQEDVSEYKKDRNGLSYLKRWDYIKIQKCASHA